MFECRKVEYSESDVQRVLEWEEDWTMDKKGKGIAPNKLSHTVSAFANFNGGEIYVGISHEEDKTHYIWDGFNNVEECNQIVDVICNIFKNYGDYSFEYCTCEKYHTGVLHVLIQKTGEVIFATDKIPYLRVGAQNVPQNTPEKRRQLEYDKGIYSFETELTNCTFDDIKDSSVLKDFISKAVPHTTAEDWLRSQFVMSPDRRISVAGVLLYSDLPQAIIPKHCGIRISRYHTDLKEGGRETLDSDFPISIEGDIYHLITKATSVTIETIEKSDVVGKRGLESKKYPEVALHEIIANAVLHRDYSISKDIQIRIYTNRVEIESPGKLPGHITPENILQEQLSRNGKIVRLITKFPSPPNKDVGEGLNTAFAAMAQMNLGRPIIKEQGNSVVVIIKHERLADHEKAVLDYLSGHESISNAEGRSITGIGDTIKMKDVFIRLRDQGVLEMVPGRKGNASRWRLKGSEKIDKNSSHFEEDQMTLY